jgi:hypothetical protein
MAGRKPGTSPAELRKWKDMQAYYKEKSAEYIPDVLYRKKKVRKHPDDRLIPYMMKKFYYDTEDAVWNVLKKQLD